MSGEPNVFLFLLLHQLPMQLRLRSVISGPSYGSRTLAWTALEGSPSRGASGAQGPNCRRGESRRRPRRFGVAQGGRDDPLERAAGRHNRHAKQPKLDGRGCSVPRAASSEGAADLRVGFTALPARGRHRGLALALRCDCPANSCPVQGGSCLGEPAGHLRLSSKLGASTNLAN